MLGQMITLDTLVQDISFNVDGTVAK